MDADTLRPSWSVDSSWASCASIFLPWNLARVLQHAIFGTQMIWSLSARSDLNKWLDMTYEIFWRGVAAEAIPANGARGSAGKEKLL